MYILGINPGHDATATLINDGTIVAAVAEERMSRVKYHFGFPYEAVKECIRIGKISPADIITVAFNFKNLFDGNANLGHHIIINESGSIDPGNEVSPNFLWNVLLNKFQNKISNSKPSQDYFKEALRRLDINSNMVVYDHHICHAASAYFDFGYPECLVVTADGAGDGLSASVTIAKNGHFKIISKIGDLYSIGRFYSAITKFLGFKRGRHEGKITGLAAYGNPELLYESFKRIISINEDKTDMQSELWNETNDFRKGFSKFGAFMKGLYYHGAHPIIMDYLDKECAGFKREDIAAAAQKLSEDITYEYVRHFVKQTGMKKVALAGGLFANVRINQKILEIPEVDEVFIHPNMGDGGTATGAAYLYYNDVLLEKNSFFNPRKIDFVYYGSSYSTNEIESVLKNSNVRYYRAEYFPLEVAKLVYEGKIVGHFNGAMEYGPRALGNRTILANATDKNINDWLNKRLKRTEFMPFAPVCLEENGNELFHNYESGTYPANFMTITFDVKKTWAEKLPAVTHVDNTARPQTINRNQNKIYYQIVQEYYKLSTLPALINTSFNVHEEPIVRTPLEALNSLKSGCIDILAIGDFIVTFK